MNSLYLFLAITITLINSQNNNQLCTFTLKTASGPRINQKVGSIKLYWNNAQIMYLSGYTTNFVDSSVWFHVTPKPGINIFSIVRDNNVDTNMYVDQVTFLVPMKNNTRQNIAINGGFQTSNGWLQPNLKTGNVQNYSSKVLILDSSNNQATQVFVFDQNLNAMLPQQVGYAGMTATNNNFYILSFDYTARANMDINSAIGHVSYGGRIYSLQIWNYSKYKYFDVFQGNKQKQNKITFFSSDPDTCSSIIIDNVRIVKVGTNVNLLGQDGKFLQPVVVCGAYPSKTLNWSTSRQNYWLTQGGVISPQLYSTVFFMCRDTIQHIF